jgi:predicted porin
MVQTSRTRVDRKRALTSLSVAFGCAVITVPSHAQSSVTLYGIIDTGIEYLNNTGSGSVAREVSGNIAGSRWGMRGNESLGGNLSAIFVLEGGFTANDGQSSQSTRGLGTNPTTTSRLFGRQAYVGLKEGSQQVTLGRQNTLVYDQTVVFDPMGAAPRYSGFGIDYDWTGRSDNSIKYIGGFGPISVSAMYSTRYDTGYGTEVAGAPTTGRFFSGAVSYSQGPLAAAVVYEQRNSNTIDTATDSERRIFAAASYDFGKVRALAGYRYLRAGSAFLPANPVRPSAGSVAGYASLFWLGARYQFMPAAQITAVLYYQDVHRSLSSSLMGVVSGDYALSKRTDVYLTVAYARNDRNANLGVNGYGSSIATGYDQTGAVLGIRHRF